MLSVRAEKRYCVILNSFVHSLEVMLKVIAPEFVYSLSNALAYRNPEAGLNECVKSAFLYPAEPSKYSPSSSCEKELDDILEGSQSSLGFSDEIDFLFEYGKNDP